MKTWEMIKELTENPEKIFKNQYGVEIRVLPDNDLFFGGEIGHNFIGITDEWEEVKDPVTFIDALKSGKRVMIKHQDLDGELSYMSEIYNEIDDVMYNISNYFTAEGVREILLNGKWYIED